MLYGEVTFPALILLPLNDCFLPKCIVLADKQRVTLGRYWNARTLPRETNGYFDSKIMSRTHAQVWEENGRIFIKDTKSSNGTFINGIRLSQDGVESPLFELNTDDIVELGVNIKDKDNQTIIHHRVAAKVECLLSQQDVTLPRSQSAGVPPTTLSDQANGLSYRGHSVYTPPTHDSEYLNFEGFATSAEEINAPLRAAYLDGYRRNDGAPEDPRTTGSLGLWESEARPESSIVENTEFNATKSLLEHLMEQRAPINLTGQVTIPNSFRAAHGGFAMVYTGIFEGNPVAVKVLKATKNRRKPATWEKSLQRRLEREIRVWAALSHQNIIPFLGYSDGFGDFTAMVSIWCPDGTASDYLSGSEEEVTVEERLRLVQGASDGLEHLHQLKIIHGDLKPTNILISDQGIAQLCDFGLVRLDDWQGPAGMTTTSPYTGTERYKAPELFATIDNKHPVATFEGDIYALGCVALEFITSSPPYHTCNTPVELRQAIENEGKPATRPRTARIETSNSSFEPPFWDILEACWAWYPENRPKAGEVVNALAHLSEIQRNA